MQSNVGQAILKQLSYPTTNFDTMLYIENNVVYEKSEAFIMIVKKFNFPIRLFAFLKYVPKRLRNFAYDVIARNRHWIFQRNTECSLPIADHPKCYL